MQHMTDDLNDNAFKVGLYISCEEMKVMSIDAISAPQIHVRQQLLECITEYQYLGSHVSNKTDLEMDIHARFGTAASVFQRLSPVW